MKNFLLKTFRWKLAASLLLTVSAAVFISSCNEDDAPKTIATLETFDATDVTDSEATVSAEITDDGNSGVVLTGFVYSTTSTTPVIETDTKVELVGVDDEFSTTLTELNSSTTYHVRAYAINSKGVGYGNTVDVVTGNAAPTATSLSVTGPVEVNGTLTANYTYSDSDGDAQNVGATTIKWYVADNSTGLNELAITGATDNTYKIVEAYDNKFISFGVIVKSAAGAQNSEEIRSGWAGAVGDATTVTFMYNGDEVTYGILNSAKTGRKWLDRNLGAPNTPTAYNDFANYGDLFQWGRLADGHQLMLHPGLMDVVPVNGMTSDDPKEPSPTDVPGHSLFILVNGATQFDWRLTRNNNLWQTADANNNNPCPLGWRIPTRAEWAAEEFVTLTDAFTKLKITASGGRAGGDGVIYVPDLGYYWSSTVSSANAYDVYHRSFGVSVSDNGEDVSFRANAYACKCIKN